MEKAEERISPEKAMKILNGQGMKVSLDEAKCILKFLRLIAGIVVENHLKKAG